MGAKCKGEPFRANRSESDRLRKLSLTLGRGDVEGDKVSGLSVRTRGAAFAAVVFTVGFLGAMPVAQAADSHPGGIPDTCEEVWRGDHTEAVKKVTVPEPGSTVAPGSTIEVKLVWDTASFEESELHKALDCVQIDGTLAVDLSVLEKPTANDGLFEHRYTVPADTPVGAQVCDRGFVSGEGSEGGFERDKTPIICFEVGPETSTPPPTPTPPDNTPTPSDNGIPPVPTQVLPERFDLTLPATVPPALDTGRAEPVSVLPESAVLPATGRASRQDTLLAGVSLFVGGAGIAAGARRRRQYHDQLCNNPSSRTYESRSTRATPRRRLTPIGRRSARATCCRPSRPGGSSSWPPSPSGPTASATA